MSSAAISTSQQPPAAPDSPTIIERRPRSSSFGSITPTFSSDLARLRAAFPSSSSSSSGAAGPVVARSYAEAIAVASTFDVLGPNSPLSRKLRLAGEAEWIEFISGSGAIVSSSVAAAAGGNDPPGEDAVVAINLEKLLRHCFDVAFKLPPPPAAVALHRRSVSGRVVLDAVCDE